MSSQPASSPWPYLEDLITHGGQVTVGSIPPVKCAAMAGRGPVMLAALQRRDEETLAQLLQRLEQAIREAQTANRVTNEIKGLR